MVRSAQDALGDDYNKLLRNVDELHFAVEENYDIETVKSAFDNVCAWARKMKEVSE